MTKTCKTCSVEKDVSEFYFRKDNNTYRSECKGCRIAAQKKYDEENRGARLEYLHQWRENNEDYISEKGKEYYQLNKENILKEAKEYYLTHKPKKQEYDKQYYIANKKEIIAYNNDYIKKKRDTDPCFKLRMNVSRLVGKAIKIANGSKNGKSILKFLPYAIEQLKEHIEKQFEPWMTWDNQGKYKLSSWKDDVQSTWTWQLDHIIPQSNLPYTSMEDNNFKKCWALENLRPLSSKQNLLDGINRTRHTAL